MMNFIIAILPVILLLNYVYKLDSHKEPKNLLKKIFYIGALTCIPAAFIEISLENIFYTDDLKYGYLNLLISVFFGIALIEELVKWIVIKTQAYNEKDFDESFDAIVYSIFSSLGFACLENIFYVFENGISIGIARAITSIPSHMYDAIFMGYFLALAKRNDIYKGKKDSYIILSILVPTTTHAIYDFLIIGELHIYWLIFHVIATIFSLILIKKLAKENKLFIENQKNTL